MTHGVTDARTAQSSALVNGHGAGHHHAVQFYSEDRFLVETAGKFLGTALEQGSPAIAVATAAHLSSIAQYLQAMGVDLPAARRLGRYLEFDAEKTLPTIMVNDRPDPGVLSGLAAEMIAQARAACQDGHQEVAFFGEMVDLLCASGRMEAAIHLEQLWNDLLQTEKVLMLCGYSVARFEKEAHAEALEKVCAQHRDVFPAEGYQQLASEQDRLRYVARLQQEAEALKTEIRERQRAQEALERAEKSAALGRLAASIAHEINNPLTSLTNLLYLLQAQESLDPGARQYASLADQELRRIAGITRQMLGFYRESARPVPCKLSEIADNVLELYESRFKKNHITVIRDYSAGSVIVGFPAEMRQLFANLIGNAIEAAGNRSKLSVRISRARSWADPRDFGVRVSIADSGHGISAEDRQRIFDPFFTTKGESGTGLGLWITQRIVHKHSGNIRVRSRTEGGRYRGTTFSIFFPGAKVKHRERPSQAPDGVPASW